MPKSHPNIGRKTFYAQQKQMKRQEKRKQEQKIEIQQEQADNTIMDPFRASSNPLKNYLDKTDVESMITESQSKPMELSISKPEEMSKIDPVEIPRTHHHRKDIQIKWNNFNKVETVGMIRRKFEEEEIAKWLPIIKRDIFVIEKCKESRFNLNRYKKELDEILTSGRPVTKVCWEDIHKLLNKNHYKYVIADGKKVRLSGCIVNEPSDFVYSSLKSKSTNKTKAKQSSSKNVDNQQLKPVVDPKIIRKRGLLSTLNDNFIPGPLSKKPKLNNKDCNSLDNLKLLSIPSVGLEVYPRVGQKLDTAACVRLNSIRQSDGLMDKKWAEFATSVIDLDSDSDSSSSHTFVLPYENNQNRILFRHDPHFKYFHRANDNAISDGLSSLNAPLKHLHQFKPKDEIQRTVVNVIEEILKSVFIGEIQDDIGTLDLDYAPVESKVFSTNFSTNSEIANDKMSIKRHRELSRLDITVIDVSDENKNISKVCTNEWCQLGCVCSSLQSSYMFNEHCGRMSCMLSKCNCKFGRNDQNDNHGISTTVVANLQHHINKNLAKEEQKFRRTIIKTKDNTIVIGASRRGQRLPNKFKDFIISDSVVEEKQIDNSLSVVNIHLNKLPSNLGIEKLCLVHNLYRCFCRGVLLNGTTINCEINDTNTMEQLNYSLELKSKQIYRQSMPDAIKKHVTDVPIDAAEPNVSNANLTDDTIKLINQVTKLATKTPKLTKQSSKVCKGSVVQKTSKKKRNSKKVTQNRNPSLALQPMTQKEMLAKAVQLMMKPEKSIYTSIPEAVYRQVIIYKWQQLVKDFQTGSVFLWVTESEPYRVYATTCGRVLSKQVCLPIVYGKSLKKNILMAHKSLKYILCCDISAFSYVAFVGRKFAWELLCSFSEKKRTSPLKQSHSNSTSDDLSPPNEDGLSHITCDLMNQSSVEFFYPKITSVQGSYIPNKHSPIELPDIKNSNLGSSFEDDPLTPQDYEDTFEEKDIKSEIVAKLDADNGSKLDSQVKAQDIECGQASSPKENSDKAKSDEKSMKEKSVTNTDTGIKSESDRASTSTAPSMGRPKYHWLSLKLGAKFNEIRIPCKNFLLNYDDAIRAMALAQKTGKTCKYPSGPVRAEDAVPEFGAYAIPGNNQEQIFLGPCEVKENISIKVSPKPTTTTEIYGTWTKQIYDPKLIVWNKGSSHNKDSVLFLGSKYPKIRMSPKDLVLSKPFTTLKISRDASTQNKITDLENTAKTSQVFNFIRLDPNMKNPSASNDYKIVKDSEGKETGEQDTDDEVIFVADKNTNAEIIELSDADD